MSTQFQFQQLNQDQIRLPGESLFHTITPYFQHINLLDQVQSEIQQKPVYHIHEAVQLRFAGDRYYSPVVPVDSMYRKEGLNVITYAERWATQYRQFLNNEAQVAEGTPLDNLTGYGITPAQLSLCRALKIYSIEALYHLEGANLKSLGPHANDLKPMAKRYMADRASGSAMEKELAALRAEVATLKAAVPEKEATQEEIDEALSVVNFEKMTEEELRVYIMDRAGSRPDGRLGKPALVNMAKGM